MTKLTVITATILLSISTAFGQTIEIGQDATEIKQIIQWSTQQRTGYDTYGNSKGNNVTWDVKYNNGKITDVIQCYSNQYLLDFRVSASFCKHYIMEYGRLAYVLTQYEDLSTEQLKEFFDRSYGDYKSGNLYFSDDYEHYSKIYLANNGYATVEWRKTEPDELPSDLKTKIANKLKAEQEAEAKRIKEEEERKQTIIENALFGVDLNPNSVKICRLRLWIELLKNAYYKAPDFAELETLPNIDINIKCGNSLISRYTLDADLKKALKSGKWTIDGYRNAVMSYRNAKTKDEKRDLERLINTIKNDFESEVSKSSKLFKDLVDAKGELFKLTNQTSLFERSKAELAKWNKQVSDKTDAIKKFESKIEEIKSNRIYENAFEWRFEFPEVLNDDGDFIGFDAIIGNPPYIRQEELGDIKPFLSINYKAFIF